MAVITRAYSETDGSIAEASSVNKVIDDLYTLQNGNINSANLSLSAVDTGNLRDSSVTTIKMPNCAVTTLKIANSGVLGSNIADGVFQFRSIDYENVILVKEVF